MTSEILVAFCTFPDAETANQIGGKLIKLRLAACANVLPQIRSTYWWQGRIQSGDEALAVFKLPSASYAAFEEKLRTLHPYDVPEIIAWPITKGLPDYLQWVGQSCLPEK